VDMARTWSVSWTPRCLLYPLFRGSTGLGDPCALVIFAHVKTAV
jgi:hypothetical protein